LDWRLTMASRKQPKMGTKTVSGVVVGRDKTVIDPNEIYKLAQLGCTIEEMSDWFGVPRETIKYNFSDFIAKGRSETKQALRRAQIALALKGNATMLIWLGKNMLGQSENPLETDTAQVLPWIESEAQRELNEESPVA